MLEAEPADRGATRTVSEDAVEVAKKIVRQAIADGEVHTTKPVNRALLVLLGAALSEPSTSAPNVTGQDPDAYFAVDIAPAQPSTSPASEAEDLARFVAEDMDITNVGMLHNLRARARDWLATRENAE